MKCDLFFVEHAVNYNEITSRLHEDNASNSMERTEEEPKFLDTINPLLSFSKADLAEMDQEFDQFFDESDSSSDDNEPVDLGETDWTKKIRFCRALNYKNYLQKTLPSTKF